MEVGAVDCGRLQYSDLRAQAGLAASCQRARVGSGTFDGQRPWTIPWPCVHEFLSIVTHPKIYQPPTALDRALEQISEWMASPSLRLIGEVKDYWNVLSMVLTDAPVVGPRIHDAIIAALCGVHEVTNLCTADRHFERFTGITVINPLER